METTCVSDCEVSMQIKKINNDKLKVILNSNDLDEKNIDIDSFLSNSIESQSLFFEILDLAEEKYDFNIENHKAIVEAVSLDNNIFILTITKLKNDSVDTYPSSSNLYCFEDINQFFNVYSFLKKEQLLSENDFIYQFNHLYYLFMNQASSRIESILSEYAFPVKDTPFLKDILMEYGKKLN